MADSTPSDVPQDPPAPQWPNTKEDYELLDVIGQCLHVYIDDDHSTSGGPLKGQLLSHQDTVHVPC